jgi:hypothetical protein
MQIKNYLVILRRRRPLISGRRPTPEFDGELSAIMVLIRSIRSVVVSCRATGRPSKSHRKTGDFAGE